MKRWPRQFSFWLALSAGTPLAVELAWLEVERRNAERLALEWRQQLRQSEELAKTSPARTPENEQAVADDVLQLRREVPIRREELFPRSADPTGEVSTNGRIDAYFDVAALIVRLRAAAVMANVIVKPDEHFGFGAYAHEAPPAGDMARVRQQCAVAETVLGCFFAGQPRELLAVRREPTETSSATVDRQLQDYFTLERGLSLRGEPGMETMAFRVEFTGDTAALRGFLTALAHTTKLLVVRAIQVAPASGDNSERADGKVNTSGPVVRQTLSHFVVTVEAISPIAGVAARAP